MRFSLYRPAGLAAGMLLAMSVGASASSAQVTIVIDEINLGIDCSDQISVTYDSPYPISLLGEFVDADVATDTLLIGLELVPDNPLPDEPYIFTAAGSAAIAEANPGWEAGENISPAYQVFVFEGSLSEACDTDEEPPGAVTTGRLFGANRIETAVKISEDVLPAPQGSEPIFIANGFNFPDALAAGPAVVNYGGGVLLLVSPTGGLPSVVRAEIERLRGGSVDPSQGPVFILGGEDNVSAAAETELRTLAPRVERIAGRNRFETSALIANQLVVRPGGDAYATPTTAIITSGMTFADALAGGAAGGHELAPLLLTHSSGLDASVLQALEPQNAGPDQLWREFDTVRILGSEATVSKNVEDQIRAILPNADIVRYAGRDRFETAAMLNSDVFTSPGGEGRAMLTNGFRFPDALAGAGRTDQFGGAMIPVRTECVPAASGAALTALAAVEIVALGNVDAVSDAALNGASCP